MTIDVERQLLREIMSLQADIKPLETRLEKAKQLLKDAITKGGPVTDEDLGVVAMLEPRYCNSYDLERLRQEYGHLAEEVIKEQVDEAYLKTLLMGGIITESDLDMHGIRTKNMIARALMIKPLKSREVLR